MTTRAGLIHFLLSGITNPSTGGIVENGTVYFYESGTTTPKYVWTEVAKTNPYYSYTLDGAGAAQLYGEGNYRVVIKDSDDTTIDTLDGIRIEFPYYGIRAVASTTSQTTQDDFLLVTTTSGAVTINCLTASEWLRPLKVQRVAGSNNIVIDPYGSETIDGSATLTVTDDSIVEIIPNGSNLKTAGFRSSFTDVDGDTKIQTEESADEDKIRFDTGGTERVVIDSNGLDVVSGALRVGSVSITATPAEINTVADGITATAAEINTACDGITATASEINTVADGITATASEINTACDGITSTAAELNQLDGVTVGGSSSGDVVTIDDTQTLTNKTLTSPTVTTPIINAAQLDATGDEIDAACDGIGVSIPKTAMVTIGDWDMDANTTVSVAHGLTLSKIVGVRALIRSDADDYRFPVNIPYASTDFVDLYVSYIDATYIVLSRRPTGHFDDTDFDSTSFNRGWIIFDYID